MVTIKQFEDLPLWQEARDLVQDIYKLTKKASFKKDFGLRDQIQRAAVSIMANTAERFDAGSTRSFIRYLLYARASAAEVQSHSYVALDQTYISSEEFDKTYKKTKNIGRSLNGFIKYLRGLK